MMHRPSKLWPGVRRTVTVAVFLNAWIVANEFCTSIGSFFFFSSSSFTIDSKWKNRFETFYALFWPAERLIHFDQRFPIQPGPVEAEKVASSLSRAGQHQNTNKHYIRESEKQKEKKEIEKEWWETEEKERPVLLREPGKRKGPAAAGTVRWGGGGRLFLFTSSQVSVRRNSFSDISCFFRFFPPFFFYWNSHCVRVAVLLLLLLLLGQHLTPKGLFFSSFVSP